MNTESVDLETNALFQSAKPIVRFNPFLGDECVLKKCCKKYKKGKRCKKCPD